MVTHALSTPPFPPTPALQTAVVFAYHNVGVRCLRVLASRGHALGLRIAMVVSHEDNPNENIWFESVQALCDELTLPCLTPDLVEGKIPTGLLTQVRALAPDYIFSFYYRHMLPQAMLDCAKKGAFNMHGSLLPHYRGRVPINWAVLHGETQTGATLHEMTAKPDAGAIVAQQAVPILPDDTAYEVFGKVVLAAEMALCDALPGLLEGTAERLPNNLQMGSYYGGRTRADGEINWQHTTAQIYNLIRAVAPPYPGAFVMLNAHHSGTQHQHELKITRARVFSASQLSMLSSHTLSTGLHIIKNHLLLVGHQGSGVGNAPMSDAIQVLHIQAWELDGQAATLDKLATLLPSLSLP